MQERTIRIGQAGKDMVRWIKHIQKICIYIYIIYMYILNMVIFNISLGFH